MSCVHNPDFECFDCETARHDVEHPELVEGCRTCKYRTIQLSPAVRGQARNTNPSTAFAPKNSWERGVAMNERGVPLLDENLQPIPIKKYGENRHKYEAARRALHQSAAGADTGE